ncbi:hypothetical protein LCDVSa134R [Lymphocystis disease virus 3]|uniref:Uncharacterized protein n=1 Tax=Lymphocystis disease virus 3 TaxID=2560566 RepID=A0A1B2RW48_9VIRU|nr:hypothetical protein BZK12_gp134 [Lymphocystis disease virus Sa]AOC55218.1 hypothetical protein LCDVSa134R [Lymphocystis disease virus 3]
MNATSIPNTSLVYGEVNFLTLNHSRTIAFIQRRCWQSPLNVLNKRQFIIRIPSSLRINFLKTKNLHRFNLLRIVRFNTLRLPLEYVSVNRPSFYYLFSMELNLLTLKYIKIVENKLICLYSGILTLIPCIINAVNSSDANTSS